MNTLKTLIEKLDFETKKTLEQAVGACLKRGHYNLEISHWLSALLTNSHPQFMSILTESNVNIEQLQTALNNDLEHHQTGNTAAPAISPRIITLINEAWLIASLEYSGLNITIPTILYTLIHNSTLKQVAFGLTAEFKKIDPIKLKKIIESTATKDESTETHQPSSHDSALKQYAINLNEQATLGKIDEVIGRELEIKQVIDILSRRRQNNAILTGEPGVGKTAIVEGLALKITQNDVPDNLKDVTLYSLDLGLLQAGASIKGEFENRLKTLISEVKSAASPIIIFIDEAHTLIGSGGAAGQNDAANLLKPALARGELRSIAATTWDEYKKYFEKDPALTRRFQVVKVNEPDTETAIRMLRSLVPSLEKHHHVSINEAAITQSVLLSQRYMQGRLLPDKAISILDTACARVSSKLTTTPTEIEQLNKLLDQLTIEQSRYEHEQQIGIIHKDELPRIKRYIGSTKKSQQKLTTQWNKEKMIVKDILKQYHTLETHNITPEQKKTIQDLNAKLAKIQKDSALVAPRVDHQSIADVISDWTGIPTGNMLGSEADKLLNLDNSLGKEIVGQSQAIQTISSSMRSAATRLSAPEKPYGVFLLTGPSGVGKTETALSLAEHIYGSRNNITVINMSEFKEAHKVSMLAGSPPGYVGYGEGGVLTEAVRRQPYSLILLDEMEKAHPSIQDVFYQVFDKGTLKDGQGREISFKNTTIIMTSNACSDFISIQDANTLSQSEHPEFKKALQDELLKTFKPAFLGRVTVVPFMPLSETVLRNIIQLKLQKIQQRLTSEYAIKLSLSNAVKDYILTLCNQANIGARQIDNIISQRLLPLISTYILENIASTCKLNDIQLTFDKNKLLVLKPTKQQGKNNVKQSVKEI